MSRQKPRAGGDHGTDPHRPIDRPPTVIACTSLRVGPHNRCTHGTPPPPGRNPCRGDHGCAFRLPPNVDLCPEHAREHRMTITEIRRETATAMGFSTDETTRMEFGHQTRARAA